MEEIPAALLLVEKREEECPRAISEEPEAVAEVLVNEKLPAISEEKEDYGHDDADGAESLSNGSAKDEAMVKDVKGDVGEVKKQKRRRHRKKQHSEAFQVPQEAVSDPKRSHPALPTLHPVSTKKPLTTPAGKSAWGPGAPKKVPAAPAWKVPKTEGSPWPFPAAFDPLQAILHGQAPAWPLFHHDSPKVKVPGLGKDPIWPPIYPVPTVIPPQGSPKDVVPPMWPSIHPVPNMCPWGMWPGHSMLPLWANEPLSSPAPAGKSRRAPCPKPR